MNVIILSVISVVIISFLCAVLLVVAATVMAVKEDPLFTLIRGNLPGANCGACGYAGCDGYANALASGEETRTNLCVPGGKDSAAAVAAALGTEAVAPVETGVAVVFCGGDCSKTTTNGESFQSCAAAADSDYKSCKYGCLGIGDCAAVCPVNAIHVENGVAVVDKELCVGCGQCEKTCPRHVIHLLPRQQVVYDRCSNPEMGKAVLSVCKAGCIGCGKCSKLCPSDAITMEGNLAIVDPEKCVGCGTCVTSCPTKCMSEL